MMKNLKLFLLSFALIAGLFTSCSNEDSVTDDQNIQETEAITTSLNRLAGQFNDEGDVIPSANPAGNIVFDFGFDFVYPLNLSFNNGTTVSVNSLEDLIQILINSTDDLFIDGIEFPFDVEVYDEATDSIVVITINSEEEFLDLLDSLWDGVEPCDCFEVYEPVCVEITDPNGESFIITYPNECYALCDGFTPNNFIDNCADDYNNPGGNDCFEFVFPFTIITDEGQTVTVNSQEELDNALYNAYYFDFVYSFDVIVNDELLTIGNEEAFIELLEYCSGETDCPCPGDVNPVCVEIETPLGGSEIITFLNACEAECEGFSSEDFIECDNVVEPCDECENEPFDPVCVEVESNNGNTEIITFPNSCYAECEGFDASDFVDCGGNTSDCTTDAVLTILLECPWTANGTTYDFEGDGTVAIEGSGLSTIGTWTIMMGNEGYPIVTIFANIGNFNDEWHFVDCNLINSLLVVSSNNPATDIALNCE